NLYGGVVAVPVGNLYRDVIGEIKCLDLQFKYKGKWRSLDYTDAIYFKIRKNPTFDLVLGRGWLWVYGVKMSFKLSPKESYNPRAKIVIDGMSIPLIDEDFNKASSMKNDPHKSDLLLEELTNMIKKSLSDIQDNKHHRIFCNMPPAHSPSRRLNDDVSKNSGTSEKNRVKYSTDSDTSSNSDTLDSSDSSLSRLRSEVINMHKTASARKHPIKLRRCK
ncbi:29412_t:CDS:1, partial [Gigaspora margarita]